MDPAPGFRIRVFEDPFSLARAAAAQTAAIIRRAITLRGKARILGGGSQAAFIDALTAESGIAWGEVEMFHVQEYVGLPANHPASFRNRLHDQLISKTRMGRYHLLDGDNDPERTCRLIGEALTSAPVDVAFVEIGENGHLAFNDPPADFQTETPYLILALDEACRRRQVGDGWFKTITDVPERGISLSIRQLLKAKAIVCVAPHARTAVPVKRCLEGAISPLAPASILRTHPDATLHLDRDSAALLNDKPPIER